MGTVNPLRTLVLASQSPRRIELLRNAGYNPVVRPSHIPEERLPGEEPAAYVERLAREKALAVSLTGDEVALAADTTVVVKLEDRVTVLEKPASDSDAIAMLKLLSGRAHDVLTGVALRFDDRMISHCERTLVYFSPLEAQEIADYVASGEPKDKAGAYGIQGRASRYIERIEGCYHNVVGLPIAQVYRMLRELPFEIRA